MTATEHVILVDENDIPIGIAEKLAAHRDNLCHRAFSIFIFRRKPRLELLIQQRAATKYHSANLWTNTCCSHPRPGEDTLTAGQRRLKEEMRIVTELQAVGRFHYIAHFDNGLTENEVDHVLIGQYEHDKIDLNPDEAQDYRWMTPSDLETELNQNPQQFTPWLKPALEVIKPYLE